MTTITVTIDSDEFDDELAALITDVVQDFENDYDVPIQIEVN
jgi:hypothetical protein